MQGKGSGVKKHRAIIPGCLYLPELPTLSWGARTHPEHTGTPPYALEGLVVKDLHLRDSVTH